MNISYGGEGKGGVKSHCVTQALEAEREQLMRQREAAKQSKLIHYMVEYESYSCASPANAINVVPGTVYSLLGGRLTRP